MASVLIGVYKIKNKVSIRIGRIDFRKNFIPPLPSFLEQKITF
jgi:hypothetical protein